MVTQKEYYVCPVCGKIIEIEYGANVPTKCCGQDMKKLEPKTADYATEKHVPYIEKVDGGVLVKVGKEAAHPMEADHYIVFIEILADGVYMKKFLKPGDKPEAFFKTDASNIVAWEMCNKHLLWKSA